MQERYVFTKLKKKNSNWDFSNHFRKVNLIANFGKPLEYN